MPKIIQFTHPGGEHGPDKDNTKHKCWNKAPHPHARKFLLAHGDYIVNEQKVSGELMFWGEWEPPSSVTVLEQPEALYPRWLHRPFLPLDIPSEKDLQNTDPFVFGGSFKYFTCKQYKAKTFRPTQLASLDEGSIILFGSTKDNSFFQLDTVFVIAEYLEYDPSDKNSLTANSVPKDYYNAVFKMAFPKPYEDSIKLRLYFGATYENPVDGMYSFSPSMVYNGSKQGFPRIALKNLSPYLTNNLNAAPKISLVGREAVKGFWEMIRAVSRKAGCVEGVRFEYEKKDQFALRP